MAGWPAGASVHVEHGDKDSGSWGLALWGGVGSGPTSVSLEMGARRIGFSSGAESYGHEFLAVPVKRRWWQTRPRLMEGDTCTRP